mmetsp:Transcript_35498/g.93330  ORF Transcript_35498/g.93330 Transcript_35498/m.93330 type:complete len:235 (+) Transcript_35498:166-870(+)
MLLRRCGCRRHRRRRVRRSHRQRRRRRVQRVRRRRWWRHVLLLLRWVLLLLLRLLRLLRGSRLLLLLLGRRPRRCVGRRSVHRPPLSAVARRAREVGRHRHRPQLQQPPHLCEEVRMLEREIESLLEDAVKDGGAQPLLVNGVLAVLLHDLEHRQVVEHHKCIERRDLEEELVRLCDELRVGRFTLEGSRVDGQLAEECTFLLEEKGIDQRNTVQYLFQKLVLLRRIVMCKHAA